MQRLRKILSTETLANSLDPMNKNWESLQSQNSGVTFPVKDLSIGQACFREDELALYVCANVEKVLWVKVADLTLTYVNKEYVDSMHIPLDRVDNIIDANTGKIKMSLIYSGTTNGQVVVVGDNNKIDTNLINTGVNPFQLVQVNIDGKIPKAVLDLGVRANQIPLLNESGDLVDSTIPDNIPRFDSSGKLIFPNGAKIWVS